MLERRLEATPVDRTTAVQMKEKTKPVRPANKTGLPDKLKTGIESLSGISLDAVRVHYGSARPAQLNALAYARGREIHLAPAQERHLPHEVWHIVQQAQGRVKPTDHLQNGVPVNNDVGLEREADVMGAKALRSTQLQPPSESSQANTHASGLPVAQRRRVSAIAPALNLVANGQQRLLENRKRNAQIFERDVPQAATKEAAIQASAQVEAQVGGAIHNIWFSNLPNVTNANNVELNRVNPFLLRTKGSFGAAGAAPTPLFITYQNAHSFQGYVTNISEGGPNAARMSKKAVATPASATPGKIRPAPKYGRNHSQTGNAVLAPAVPGNEAQMDAYAKLAGEGARWQCVRQGNNLTDNTIFYTSRGAPPGHTRGVRFRRLWTTWARTFNKAYDISNETVKIHLAADPTTLRNQSGHRVHIVQSNGPPAGGVDLGP